MFAEFEKRIHEKMAEEGTLTADGISELYLSINKEYFGPDMISDPQIALEWARIPHFLYTVLCISVCNGIFGGDCDQQQDPGRGAGYRGEVQTVLKRRLLDGSDRPFEDLRRRYDEAGACGRGAGCVCFLCGGVGEADRGSVSTGFKVA